MDKTIKWGIIGCGDVAEQKSGPAFNKVANSKLLAVMRRDAEKAADYAKRHQVEQWYSNAGEVFNNPDIDAIYIATPPSSHLEYTLAALEKGLPVYVEKPVSRNTAEALQMAEAVKKHNGKLVVAHYRRKVPLFLKVKELLDKQAIGEVRTVQLKLWQSVNPELVTKAAANWRTNPEISGGGYFHDLSPHQLDLMLYFFGEPLKYEGFSTRKNKTAVADQVSGSILFQNQIVFNGSWCFNVAPTANIDLCEIIGSEGSIQFAVFGKTISLKTNLAEEVFNFVHPEHIEQPMIESVVRYINGEEPNPCTIDEAIIIMKIIDNFSQMAPGL
ncbi:Gfo/Idh/MocA family oxidoreductase [Pedobacter aquatilis]|uniref:Gfo/Idh/MocA family protein n=1 Tax=Pedobacter aquatilis TaxID=351343 RepID=UPI00292D713B|nr:Gfo/Idh/MocA family oxidoreductase [Pedobacter aquatilis]